MLLAFLIFFHSPGRRGKSFSRGYVGETKTGTVAILAQGIQRVDALELTFVYFLCLAEQKSPSVLDESRANMKILLKCKLKYGVR